jgi:hypothetical protein
LTSRAANFSMPIGQDTEGMWRLAVIRFEMN